MTSETDTRARLTDLIAALESVSDTASEAAAPVELDQARVGRLSRMDALQAQAMSREAGRRRALALTRARAALARLDAGEYGDCVRCGEPVDARRLTLDPAATLCIACARANEA